MPDESAFSLRIDGSTQYLGIEVPAGASPLRAEAVDLLKRNGFQLDVLSRVWRLRDRHRVLTFLAEHGPALRERFHARFAPEFFQRTANLSTATLAAEASPRADGGFDFLARVEAAGADSAALRLALARNQAYAETPGGKIVLLPSGVLRAASALARALNPAGGGAPEAETRCVAGAAELADIENTLDALAVPFTPPQTWRERSAALRNLGALRRAPVAPALESRLRLYQQIGVAWLWHLHAHKLGGVLADEMGLGKTVQALAFLDALFSGGGADVPISALVVCPSALLENWRREAARFTPDLAVRVHHGAARARSPEELPAGGLVITSYGTLARDLALFRGRNWAVVVADEAQHVKNRRSQNARSLLALRAGGRFALTGTPVENSLDDLRSLFAFLMPGYLSAEPERGRAGGAEQRLWRDQRDREKAAPYILRRAKRSVAPELPEKIEQTVFVELEGAQRELYDARRERARAEIFELEMGRATEGRLRVAAFNHLLRLRQICAEPRLLAPELSGADSAKLRALREILDEAADGGHRALVFSQFVEVLQHLRRDLDAAGVASCYLDGATRDRQAECDRFNSTESIPVFLISLKAGGTGLNLTGADTVVHFDPWWNPAVEAQATDRAHRIGQTRVVTSLKLIAASTVEERVMELQREKAALLRDLFEGSDAANARISLADLKTLLE